MLFEEVENQSAYDHSVARYKHNCVSTNIDGLENQIGIDGKC